MKYSLIPCQYFFKQGFTNENSKHTSHSQRHSFTHIVNTLVDLAKHEGTLMTFEGLLRHGIEVDEEMMDSMLGVSQDSAAQCVVQLRDCGAITSPAVYEMVKHVEQLAMRLAPDWWKQIVPWSVQPLRYYKKEAMAKRERFIVRHRERQYPFLVYVTGQVEYPEDDPLYGTYVTEGTFLVGKAKTIHDALECAKKLLRGVNGLSRMKKGGMSSLTI